MKPLRTRSIISILKSTNDYLLLAISLFIIVLALAGTIILYQSHKTVCALFNTKMETTGLSIARELALGEKNVAANLFNSVVGSLRKVSSEVDLDLKDGGEDVAYDCKARVINAKVSHELSFSGGRVGIIHGEIKSFNFNLLLSFIISIILFLFLMLKFIKNKLILNIRNQIVTPIELLCTQELTIHDDLPDEVKDISKKLNVLRDSISLSERAKQELSNAEKISNIASQVAHDIRSPLEVLKSINSELDLLPSDTKRMMQLCISRIEEIAFNLLNSHKQSMTTLQADLSEELLSLLIEVLLEKRIEFRNRTSVEINGIFDKNSYGLFSIIQRNTLKNIISNLINNGVEAFNSLPGNISISLECIDRNNIIKVFDNGSGISSEIKDKLFTKGFTSKNDGNGLGLYNAKQDIEAVGGTIGFESEMGSGTTFTITLPKAKAPPTFVDAIHVYKYDRIIILDDDPAFHEVWNKRLEGLDAKVEHTNSVKEMLSKYKTLHSKILLLSDFELMDKDSDGIDIILQLNHASHSVLVTARSEEKQIQDRCIKAGIKLLPKSLVNYVKVFVEAEKNFGGDVRI